MSSVSRSNLCDSFLFHSRSRHFDAGGVQDFIQEYLDLDCINSQARAYIAPKNDPAISQETALHECVKAITTRLCKRYPNITSNDKVLGGTPTLLGSRLSIGDVLSSICVHHSIDTAIDDYDNRYTTEQFEDALRFARDLITEVASK